MFLIGARFKRNIEAGAITLELGFLGDLLVGIGTGTLAYCAVVTSGVTNVPAIVTGSLLAGYGGFTYLQKYKTVLKLICSMKRKTKQTFSKQMRSKLRKLRKLFMKAKNKQLLLLLKNIVVSPD